MCGRLRLTWLLLSPLNFLFIIIISCSALRLRRCSDEPLSLFSNAVCCSLIIMTCRKSGQHLCLALPGSRRA
ncbi:hypothetical protein B0H10DRAFT_2004240 [Mycena sp. CBHHK59/15]|nr:hypothetical protein B0H10DRAFT_2004240 [Mycena sp. CBHHK59/15]